MFFLHYSLIYLPWYYFCISFHTHIHFTFDDSVLTNFINIDFFTISSILLFYFTSSLHLNIFWCHFWALFRFFSIIFKFLIHVFLVSILRCSIFIVNFFAYSFICYISLFSALSFSFWYHLVILYFCLFTSWYASFLCFQYFI